MCSILVIQAASHLQAYYFISLPLTSGCLSDGMGNPERDLGPVWWQGWGVPPLPEHIDGCAACQSLGVAGPTKSENASFVLIEGLF